MENQRQDSDSPVLRLFVHPVVQSFMQQHGRIEKRIQQNILLCCSQYVLDHRDQNPALAAEDVNIQTILCGSRTTQDSNESCIDALIVFTLYRGSNGKPNLEVAKHAVSMAKAFGNKKYIALSLWYLGNTYHLLGEYYAAYDNLQEAYQLYKDLLPDNPELQRLCCRCGIAMVYDARLTFDDGDKVVSLARDVEKEAATVSDDYTHAWSLMTLGLVLNQFGDREEALRHLERVKQMGISDLRYSVYFRIALVHYKEKRLPEALDAAEEAWKISEPGNNLAERAETSFLLGRILFSADRDTEAWKYIEISLTNNLELGNRRDSALTLEYMGYGYLRRGDYLNAYGAYRAAAESYLGTFSEENGTRCKDNMAKIKDMQRNPDLNVGFERPGLDMDWPSLFYPGAASV